MMAQKDRIEAAIRHIQTAADVDPWAMELAVDALKAQGTCEDAVSRQTLQKELALYPIDDVTSEDEAGYNRAINDVQKMVLHLPSVQPQSTMGQVNDTAQSTNDCISRHAAIELIERMKPYHQEADDIAEMIANMPSAQPEIIRCLDCKYWREHKYAKETKRYIPFCGFNAIYTKADDFCSRAERRTE